MAKEVKNLFISYAKKNHVLANSFMESFKEYVKPSKRFDYKFWQDVDLMPGDKWKDIIEENLSNCDIGILLISTAFLSSTYISEVELKSLINNKKMIIPVMLSKINFNHHDLKGLDEYQIFRLNSPDFKCPRSYGELKPKRREDFIDGLFEQMENRLVNSKD